jgi:hypothetical protein
MKTAATTTSILAIARIALRGCLFLTAPLVIGKAVAQIPSAIRKAMPKLADASEDPRDYQLVHFNINPKVFAPTGSRGRLGLSIRDVRVELVMP